MQGDKCVKKSGSLSQCEISEKDRILELKLSQEASIRSQCLSRE